VNAEEFDITIDAKGEVRVHLRGVKGRHCIDYARWLSEIIGPVRNRQLTAEHYEPEGKVRVDLDQGIGG
jgi:hypothetical protein